MSTPSRLRWTVRSPQDLGHALAGAREARGLTQAELAERTSMHRSYLAALEAGPDVIALERALRALRRLGATVTITIDDDGASA